MYVCQLFNFSMDGFESVYGTENWLLIMGKKKKEICVSLHKSVGIVQLPILRENCSYSDFFWSLFSGISIEYGKILRISLYSVQMRENTDQKISEYGHFSRSAVLGALLLNIFLWTYFWQ